MVSHGGRTKECCSQNNLGAMYKHGEGVPQDFNKAYMWFNLAAAAGIELAKDNQDRAIKQMTPGQIAEGQRLAQYCLPSYQN